MDDIPKRKLKLKGPRVTYKYQHDKFDGMAKGHAANSWKHQSMKYKALSELQPVKIYTPEEIEEYKRRKK